MKINEWCVKMNLKEQGIIVWCVSDIMLNCTRRAIHWMEINLCIIVELVLYETMVILYNLTMMLIYFIYFTNSCLLNNLSSKWPETVGDRLTCLELAFNMFESFRFITEQVKGKHQTTMYPYSKNIL